MSVKRSRPPGRPSAAELALYEWAFIVAKDIELYQQELDFVASGDSLNEYEVSITKKNQIDIYWSNYLKYSTSGRGRKPGGDRAPISVLADWLKVKGITPPDDFWPKTNRTKTGLSMKDRAINSFAAAIAVSQQRDGNQVHKGRRPGIPVELIINESFDTIANKIAFDVATAAADKFVKDINSYKK